MEKAIHLRVGNYQQPILLGANPVTSFVSKVIKQRAYLLKHKIGLNDVMMIENQGLLIKEMTVVPNRSILGWCRWFQRDDIKELILHIMPGIKNSARKKFMKEFEQLPEYCAKVIATHLNNKPVN